MRHPKTDDRYLSNFRRKSQLGHLDVVFEASVPPSTTSAWWVQAGRLATKGVMEVMTIPSSRIRYLRTLLALCALALFSVFGTSAASAANTFPFTSCMTVAADIVSPSCFEGADGNLTTNLPDTNNRIDWDRLVRPSLPAPNPPATQYQDPRNPVDDVFKASTAKEQTPGVWVIESDKAPSKADILNTVFYTQLIPEAPGHIFLYGGFENDAGGNVNLSFELNHGTPSGDLTFNPNNAAADCSPVPAPVGCIPYRTNNDVLITYDGNIGHVDIGLCYWKGDNLTGNWYSQPNGGGVAL